MSASQTLTELAAQHNMLAECSTSQGNNSTMKKADGNVIQSPVAAQLVYTMAQVQGHAFINDPNSRQFVQDSSQNVFTDQSSNPQTFTVDVDVQPPAFTVQSHFQRDTTQQQFGQSTAQTFATTTVATSASQIVFPGQPLDQTEDNDKAPSGDKTVDESPSESGDEVTQTQKKLLVAADALAEAFSKADLERALSMPKYSVTSDSSVKEPGEVKEEEEVKCEICDRLYSSGKHLKRHLRTHQEYRPYKCDVCEKSFFDLNKLKRHHLTHTGLKPYACHICDQKLSRPEHLKRHILTHSEMKPYKCSICEFSARRNDSVKTHIRTKHPGLDVPIVNLSSALLTSLQSLSKNEVILTPESELNNQTDNPQGLMKVRLAPPPVPNPNKKKSKKKKKKSKPEPGEVTETTTETTTAATETSDEPTGVMSTMPVVVSTPAGHTTVMMGHPILTMSTSIGTLGVPTIQQQPVSQSSPNPSVTTSSSETEESPTKKVKLEGKSSCSGGQPLMPPTTWASDTVRMSTVAMNQLQWDGNVNMTGIQFPNLMSTGTAVRPTTMVFADRFSMQQGEQQAMTMPMTMTFPQQQQLVATTAGLTPQIKQEPINMMSMAPHQQMMTPQQIGFMQSSFGASGMPTQVSLSPYFMNAMPAQLPSRMYLNGLPNRMKSNNRR